MARRMTPPTASAALEETARAWPEKVYTLERAALVLDGDGERGGVLEPEPLGVADLDRLPGCEWLM